MLEMDGGDSQRTLCVHITPQDVHLIVNMDILPETKQNKKNTFPNIA